VCRLQEARLVPRAVQTCTADFPAYRSCIESLSAYRVLALRLVVICRFSAFCYPAKTHCKMKEHLGFCKVGLTRHDYNLANQNIIF